MVHASHVGFDAVLKVRNCHVVAMAKVSPPRISLVYRSALNPVLLLFFHMALSMIPLVLV